MDTQTDKNIVMCLSPGRSGTELLSRLLSLAGDTRSVHEPEPTFRAVTEAVRTSPDETLQFVRGIKLPHILSVPETNYVETSHLFGKGPFDAFMETGVPFRLLILNRDPRKVARSHWRIKAVPSRSKKKQCYLLHPGQGNVLKLPGWQKMTDYQLCYWYCLEMERRKERYAAQCRHADVPVTELYLEDILDFDGFDRACADLGLELQSDARQKHAELTSRKINKKEKYLPKLAFRPLCSQEEQVWDALGEEGTRLHRAVSARYGWN